MAPLLGAVQRATLASFHPCLSSPWPKRPSCEPRRTHCVQSSCRNASLPLQCQDVRTLDVVVEEPLSSTAAIASMGFPEHGLPRMCPDCSSGRAWQPLSRPGLLSHQIINCQQSSLCNLGAWSEHKGAAYSRDFTVPSQTGCVAAGREVTAARAPPAPARHTQSQYCSRVPSSYLHPLQRELTWGIITADLRICTTS